MKLFYFKRGARGINKDLIERKVRETVRKELIKKVAIKEWVKKPELYKLYQRKDRKDVVTLIKTLDLCFASDCLIAK